MYDDVPLLAMLDEYLMLRQEREEEKRRLRVCSYLMLYFIVKPINSQLISLP
jgi:hypothetical protein